MSSVVGAIIALALILWLARRIAVMARGQGRNFYLWLALGVLVPIPAALILIVLRRKRPPEDRIASQF